jgi:hypothetical protein
MRGMRVQGTQRDIVPFRRQDYHRQITSNTTGLDWDNAEVTFEKAQNIHGV